MASRARALAAAALAVVGVVSCDGPAGDGPLTVEGDRVATCLPVATGLTDYSYGLHALRNESDEDQTIRSVELVDPRSVELVEAWLVPLTATNLIGSSAGWAPYWRNVDRGVRVGRASAGGGHCDRVGDGGEPRRAPDGRAVWRR